MARFILEFITFATFLAVLLAAYSLAPGLT